MLDHEGFDLWADGYDASVEAADEINAYPFAGYRDVLGRIYQQVLEKPKAAVLDIGFGTGTLTTRLYERGCTIYGQAFSENMLTVALKKMPGAFLYLGDFAQGLAKPLLRQKYDAIIATYSLHHLTDKQKISLLNVLINQLNEGGKILIGDIAFQTRLELEKCHREAGEGWDDEEFYFVSDEMKENFPHLSFAKVSHCAGIITIIP